MGTISGIVIPARPYREMSDDEVKDLIRKIFLKKRFLDFKDEEDASETVKKAIKDELGYEGDISVSSYPEPCADSRIWQFIALIYGPSGETLTVF